MNQRTHLLNDGVDAGDLFAEFGDESAFIRSGLQLGKLQQAVHVGQRIHDFVSDAGRHLAEGDDFFLADHGALVKAESAGHGADALILFAESSALAAEVAGDVVGQCDGQSAR